MATVKLSRAVGGGAVPALEANTVAKSTLPRKLVVGGGTHQGFNQDGDTLELPANPNGDLKYYNNAGIEQWSYAATDVINLSGTDYFGGFAMDYSAGLLYVLITDTNTNIRIATINAAGTINGTWSPLLSPASSYVVASATTYNGGLQIAANGDIRLYGTDNASDVMYEMIFDGSTGVNDTADYVAVLGTPTSEGGIQLDSDTYLLTLGTNSIRFADANGVVITVDFPTHPANPYAATELALVLVDLEEGVISFGSFNGVITSPTKMVTWLQDLADLKGITF